MGVAPILPSPPAQPRERWKLSRASGWTPGIPKDTVLAINRPDGQRAYLMQLDSTRQYVTRWVTVPTRPAPHPCPAAGGVPCTLDPSTERGCCKSVLT